MWEYKARSRNKKQAIFETSKEVINNNKFDSIVI